MATPVSAAVRDAVKRHILPYRQSRLRALVEEVGQPLAIKYIESRWAREYPLPASSAPGGRLKISTSLGYTWGTATYVAPLAFPLSTAIYGRIGVVARFDPEEPPEWKIFDATDPWATAAYLRWLEQQAIFPLLTLTMHSQFANQLLRDAFRTTFAIDCVLFRPDQVDLLPGAGGYHGYTQPSDVWMAVSDWANRDPASGRLRRDFSDRFDNARFTVLVGEEFQPVAHDLVRTPMIGDTSPGSTGLANAIATAYSSGAGAPVPV
jgi:hypothetical protein